MGPAVGSGGSNPAPLPLALGSQQQLPRKEATPRWVPWGPGPGPCAPEVNHIVC